MSLFESLSVDTVNMPHHSLEVSVRGLKSHVIVGIHETIRKDLLSS